MLYSELSLIIVDAWTRTPIEPSTSSPGNPREFSKRGLTGRGEFEPCLGGVGKFELEVSSPFGGISTHVLIFNEEEFKGEESVE